MVIKNKIYAILSFSTCLMCFGCSNDPMPQDNSEVKITNTGKPESVKTMKMRYVDFKQELLANGKLDAIHTSDLKFATVGNITVLSVKEGDIVKKGQVIAALDDRVIKNNYRQSAMRYNLACLDYQDQLIRAGYSLADTSIIEDKIKKIARLRSGLSQAEVELQQISNELEAMQLRAPYDGKIANLKAGLQNNSNNNFGYICTIVDDRTLSINFQILEQELGFIHRGSIVCISPFSNTELKVNGIVASINPMIDQSGMVDIKATVPNFDGRFIDGMSVNVEVLKYIKKQLVIPRQAVLDRQGRKVVFTMVNGKAKWNYVEIAFENNFEYAIKSGIKEGDQVIIDGNFNLAHDKPVEEIR
jgi:RND family efflux transporter MFP subunit